MDQAPRAERTAGGDTRAFGLAARMGIAHLLRWMLSWHGPHEDVGLAKGGLVESGCNTTKS